MKRMISMGLILILISFLNGGMAADLDVSTLYKDRDVEDGWKMEEVETIRLSENGAEVSDTDMMTVPVLTLPLQQWQIPMRSRRTPRRAILRCLTAAPGTGRTRTTSWRAAERLSVG